MYMWDTIFRLLLACIRISLALFSMILIALLPTSMLQLSTAAVAGVSNARALGGTTTTTGEQ